MGNKYSAEERSEAVRLSGEIGVRGASTRLGINQDTIYTWVSKAKQREAKAAETAAWYGGTEGLAAENERLRKQLLEREEEILHDALGFSQSAGRGKQLRIAYITAHRGRWTVAAQCRTLGVSEAGYYKHLRREGRPDRHAPLLAQIKACFQEDAENANYGVGRIVSWLRMQRGFQGSERTVRRVCHANGLMIHPKRNPNGVTKADREARKSENLIKQDFTAEVPNLKWLTYITEVPCKDAKLYLSPVLDCYDGSIVGYQMDTSMRAELCVGSFKQACRRTGASGMVLHSDRAARKQAASSVMLWQSGARCRA